MNLGIKNKYALVTGGSHGIGRSIALALADEGCNVAICGRNKERLAIVSQEINKKGVQCIILQADATEVSRVDEIMNTIIESWGTVHIVINNVGGGGSWGDSVIENAPEKIWVDVFNKNTLTAIRFTTKAIPFMRKQKWGRIVSVSSIYGKEAGGMPWYNLAKSAQISLMKTLSSQHYLARDNITFNCVAPGPIMIPDTGWEKMMKKDPIAFKKLVDDVPLGRLGSPEEVACVVAFLCSEPARYVNGATIPIDGGLSKSF